MRVRVYVVITFLCSLLWANSPFYAVQTHFGQYRRADMDSLSMELQLDIIQEAGIQMIRDECLWSDVEIDSGVYVIPPEVDRYVAAALSRNIDVYMILNYNNSIYAPSNGSGVTSEENRKAFARYCQAVVSHFAPLGIKHYEIWNEPNHGVLFWTPQPNAIDYTLLLHTAYDSIKAIDTSLTVIGCATSPAIGNPSPYIEGLDFIRDVFAAGGGNYMDAVSFHLYQVAYRPEYELISYVNSVKSFVGNKPIYFSEFGYPTHTAWPNISLEKQASYVSRMFLTCLNDPQIKSVVYYDLKNDGTVHEEPEHNFGLLEFNRSPKPSYTSLKNLIKQTNALRPRISASKNDIFISEFSDSLNVIWSYSGIKSLDLQVSDNYFRVENMFGDTLAYHITSDDTVKLEINENPEYCITQGIEPIIHSFAFDFHNFLLYPGESIHCNYTSFTQQNVPIFIDPSAINWSYLGSNGLLSENSFTASSPGSGLILAEIQGIIDTIHINIMDIPSFYTTETFSDTAGFYLESSYLDMANSYLNEQSGSNWDALAINYKYLGSSAIAYLHKNMLINHLADSIFMDFKTDDKEYEFRIYCKDGAGISYTLGLRPRPTNWVNSWGTLGGPINIDESATPPVYINKIYIKLKPGSTAQTAPYTGVIMFDNLRIKRSVEVGIRNDIIIPKHVQLSQNYPNPFNGMSRIHFTLPQDSHVRLDLINLEGKIISTPLNDHLSNGSHYFDLNINDLTSGIYICRISTPKESASIKVAYIK
jgi:polysaccharide biosynthesis protein PslG